MINVSNNDGRLHSPYDLGLRSKSGSGFGITWPVAFDTLTFVPSSRNRRDVFVGFLLKQH